MVYEKEVPLLKGPVVWDSGVGLRVQSRLGLRKLLKISGTLFPHLENEQIR